ncbi:hypothetical protein FH972_021454 [Carpinus fangiana]|uniref:Glycosyl hydrolase family 92 domain-containing protein n=1 Tax=Carpinus fangiana TaxID=176857 RepID=A0A5N6KQ08_9ROSI|nr:hypothetical protein FH972_021454 [Carpinus fangiana]
MRLPGLSATLAAFPALALAAPRDDYTQYVSLFRGTTNGGNMFPGVTPEPFSVIKIGPDVQASPPTDAYSGYLPPPGRVLGFSMMHESGTGGAPKYGVVSQMPVTGDVTYPAADLSQARKLNDTATVGYYQSTLENGVAVSLSGTAHAGMLQHDFTEVASDVAKNVVVDIGHFLSSYRGRGWGQGFAGGNLTVRADGGYQGSGIYNGGWNIAPNWTIHFCGTWDQPVTRSKLFKGNETTHSAASNGTASTISTASGNAGAVFTFDATTVTSRIGVSFVSPEKACRYVDDEIPPGTALDNVVAQSRKKWNDKVLSKIRVESNSRDDLVQLYSNLYGMHLIPSNRTGEQPFTSTEPYYDDIFTYWDLFRCSTALMHIISPVAYVEQLRSLVEIWRKEGWMPDARSSNWSGEIQGGTNADNVLADAYVKGVQGVNWEDAYMAMRKDAETTPPNNRDPRAPDSSTTVGRGALPDWLKFGYITPKFSRAVSRGIEYAANDFGLAQVAKGLHCKADYKRYLKRSRNWRNYWSSKQTSLNYTGFLSPRLTNGSLKYPYDPLACGGCYWTDPYYEVTPWEYTFAAGHHDMAHVLSLSGGKDAFVAKLEQMFVPGATKQNSQFNGTIINPGNEPSFTTPYLFNYAGRQDLSVKYSRYIARTYYNSGIGGIPGNSDAGAMQTWQLWNMMGLYPMTGQNVFLIGSPWFSSMSLDLEGGKSLTIKSAGGDLTKGVFYVQSLKVNGKKWKQSWATWDDLFANGGTMEFKLGPKAVNWATGKLPPSPAS